jgi:hypothetical protein
MFVADASAPRNGLKLADQAMGVGGAALILGRDDVAKAVRVGINARGQPHVHCEGRGGHVRTEALRKTRDPFERPAGGSSRI